MSLAEIEQLTTQLELSKSPSRFAQNISREYTEPWATQERRIQLAEVLVEHPQQKQATILLVHPVDMAPAVALGQTTEGTIT